MGKGSKTANIGYVYTFPWLKNSTLYKNYVYPESRLKKKKPLCFNTIKIGSTWIIFVAFIYIAKREQKKSFLIGIQNLLYYDPFYCLELNRGGWFW